MSGGECNNLKFYAKMAETGEWYEVGEIKEATIELPNDVNAYNFPVCISGSFIVRLETNNQRRMRGKRPRRRKTIKLWNLKNT